MDPDQVPAVFANRMILQIADHLTGGGLVVAPRDFLVMRLVFRQRGGEWAAIQQGDVEQIDLLKDVITTWSKMPGRKTVEDEFV